MKAYFLRLFLFDQWANERIIESLKTNNLQSQEIMKIMSHLAFAHHNWLYRFTENQNDLPIWETVSIEEISNILKTNSERWLSAIAAMDEDKPGSVLSYKNMKKEAQFNTVQDVLAHVVNHASYHRGQVIFLIRQAGFTPPATDFIVFARQYPVSEQ